ncbi:MAG: hypothetical protein ACRDSH_24855 [Pseudonocardiaceae bacterium]
MTTTVELLAAIHTHLIEFELPPVASVNVASSTSSPQVSVQLACHEPPAVAAALLAWADTLTEVTAHAWRVPRGDSVHLSVTGLLPHGTSVLVYAGLGDTHHLGADLPPGASTTITLTALRHTATVTVTEGTTR